MEWRGEWDSRTSLPVRITRVRLTCLTSKRLRWGGLIQDRRDLRFIPNCDLADNPTSHRADYHIERPM